IALRVNPGFGQGHVDACDTGGPSSKHGIWPDRLAAMRDEASAAGLEIVLLHAHVGTGPELREFDINAGRLIDFFEALIPDFPHVMGISLGGGIPHPYRRYEPAYDVSALTGLLTRARAVLTAKAGRPI